MQLFKNRKNETTSDLMVDRVHTNFLKAKSAASKEENMNLWETMSGRHWRK